MAGGSDNGVWGGNLGRGNLSIPGGAQTQARAAGRSGRFGASPNATADSVSYATLGLRVAKAPTPHASDEVRVDAATVQRMAMAKTGTFVDAHANPAAYLNLFGLQSSDPDLTGDDAIGLVNELPTAISRAALSTSRTYATAVHYVNPQRPPARRTVSAVYTPKASNTNGKGFA